MLGLIFFAINTNGIIVAKTIKAMKGGLLMSAFAIVCIIGILAIFMMSGKED